MRKEAINTFTDGLSLDSNELSTPNNSLSYALNATLITRNGDEFVLQNDMGNGRVETAFLPAGFVPVGVKEHAGIIYVASHNPLTEKSQLGSFPSPERNLMSEEVVGNKELTKLARSDFYDGTKVTSAYIKKSLIDDKSVKIRPGDKFLVGVKELNNSLAYVVGSDKSSEQFPKFIRLHLAVIDDDNAISYLEEEENPYWTPVEINKEGTDEGGDFTLEGYRDFINNNYIVYTNKTSGTLAIIAELEAIESYEVNWKYDITKQKDDSYKVEIQAVNNWDTEFLRPYAISHELTYSDRPSINIHAVSNDKELSTLDNKLDFPGPEDPLIINSLKEEFFKNAFFKYKSTPSMFYGPLNHMTREGIVDLSKINSGIIDLTTYRYYVDTKANLMNMSWGINAYLKDYQKIDNIHLDYIEFKDANKIGPSISWDHPLVKRRKLKNRITYLGTFEDIIPLEETGIKPNSFYFTRLVIDVKENDKLIEGYVTKNRFLYTTGIFNYNYIVQDYLDFNDIPISGEINIITRLKEGIQRTLLDNYTEIASSVSVKPVIDPVTSFARTDFMKEYDIEVDYEIVSDSGVNKFYGENTLDQVELKRDLIKTGITHNLDVRESYEQIGSGDVSSLYDFMEYKSSNDLPYSNIKNDQNKDTEKYSLSIENNTLRITGTEIKKAVNNYNKKEFTIPSILESYVNIHDKVQMTVDLAKILGTDSFLTSRGDLNLKKALYTMYSSGTGNWLWLGVCELLQASEQTSRNKIKDIDWVRGTTKKDKDGFKLEDTKTKTHYWGESNQEVKFDEIVKKSYSFGADIKAIPFVTAYGTPWRDHNQGIGIRSTDPSKTESQEVKGNRAINNDSGGYPLFLGLPDASRKPGELKFRLLNARTATNNYDTGLVINDYSLPYKKSMLNLIMCLFSQVFRVTEQNSSRVLFSRDGTLINKNSLKTSFGIKVETSVVSKPDHIFGEFNRDRVSTFSNLVEDLPLVNIPAKDSFKFNDDVIVFEHEYVNNGVDVNSIKLKLTENIDIKSLSVVPIILKDGTTTIKYIISPVVFRTDKLYYYNIDGDDMREVPSYETRWLRDDDYAGNILGEPKKTNIGKYLELDENRDLVVSPMKHVGCIYRHNEGPNEGKFFNAYIHEAYIFEETKIIK